jgi:hypothetical protein
MLLRALVELWPDETGVFIDELPGYYLGAPSRAAALEDLPDSVETHLYWLGTHGFDLSSFINLEIEIVEELSAPDGRRGPLFELDREFASAGRVEQALRVAALTRRDLIDLYRSVSGVRRDGVRDAGGWSIADHLTHVAKAEVFYATALSADTDQALPADPVRAMQASAARADSILRALSNENRSRVFERSGEEWTAAKVLRRMTSHLREHYPWVRHLAHG